MDVKAPIQYGDVPVTYADTRALERDFGFKPSTDLRTGLRNFADTKSSVCMCPPA